MNASNLKANTVRTCSWFLSHKIQIKTATFRQSNTQQNCTEARTYIQQVNTKISPNRWRWPTRTENFNKYKFVNKVSKSVVLFLHFCGKKKNQNKQIKKNKHVHIEHNYLYCVTLLHLHVTTLFGLLMMIANCYLIIVREVKKTRGGRFEPFAKWLLGGVMVP